MSERVRWLDGDDHRASRCACCGDTRENVELLQAAHWLEGRPALTLVRCGGCQSAFFVEEDAHADYPTHSLDDPNFTLLLHHYIELVSGLSWKLRLLEQMPFGRFRSVLELGCNVGVALDYCATAWNADVVGLEPSSYGEGGRKLLGLPILQSKLEDCEEIRGRKFDFVFATEVIEHIAKPVDVLTDIRQRLAPGGVMLLTVPTAENVRRDAEPGELYATLSAGAHYFVPSERAIREMVHAAGFPHVQRWRYGNSQVVVASLVQMQIPALPGYDERACRYFEHRLKKPESDARVRLAHQIDLYESSLAIGRTAGLDALGAHIDRDLISQFGLHVDDFEALDAALSSTKNIFDFGRITPYGLPKYLRGRANHEDDPYFHALCALVCVHGLRVDYQNLYVYHQRLRWALDALAGEVPTRRATEVLAAVMRELSQVPELREMLIEPPASRKGTGLGLRKRLWALANRFVGNRTR